MIFRSLVRFLIDLFVRLTTKVTVIGFENLPAGAYIATANHLGRLDVPLIYYLLRRDDIILIAAEKYQKNPVWRWAARQLDAIFVDRFNADFQALRKVLQRLKQGGVFVIAPEGTRSKTGGLLKGRPGASFLAAKAGVPVVPVAVTGTEDAVVGAQFHRLKRANVTLRIGTPYTLPPVAGPAREAALDGYTEEIMCQIAALLPPNYRGHYTDYPRVQELQQPAQPA